MALTGQKVVVVGGSSGIGLATAQAAFSAGAEVTITGRSQEKLEQARKTIGEGVKTHTLDNTEEAQIQAFASEIGAVDHLVLPGSSLQAGDFRKLSTEQAKKAFDSKFWGQYLMARYTQINPTGSITFFSGIFDQKPPVGYSIVAAINAGIEGLGRALAVELAPIRVNVISPGIIDTPIYSSMPNDAQQQFLKSTADSLPVKRVGKPEDIAEAVLYLMQNGFTTGTVLLVDGGSLIV